MNFVGRHLREAQALSQVIARPLIADGREQEVQEVREFISTIVLDPDAHAR